MPISVNSDNAKQHTAKYSNDLPGFLSRKTQQRLSSGTQIGIKTGLVGGAVTASAVSGGAVPLAGGLTAAGANTAAWLGVGTGAALTGREARRNRRGMLGIVKSDRSQAKSDIDHADYVANAVVDQMITSGRDRLPAELHDKDSAAKRTLVNAVRDQVILPQVDQNGFFSSDRLGRLFGHSAVNGQNDPSEIGPQQKAAEKLARDTIKVAANVLRDRAGYYIHQKPSTNIERKNTFETMINTAVLGRIAEDLSADMTAELEPKKKAADHKPLPYNPFTKSDRLLKIGYSDPSTILVATDFSKELEDQLRKSGFEINSHKRSHLGTRDRRSSTKQTSDAGLLRNNINDQLAMLSAKTGTSLETIIDQLGEKASGEGKDTAVEYLVSKMREWDTVHSSEHLGEGMFGKNMMNAKKFSNMFNDVGFLDDVFGDSFGAEGGKTASQVIEEEAEKRRTKLLNEYDSMAARAGYGTNAPAAGEVHTDLGANVVDILATSSKANGEFRPDDNSHYNDIQRGTNELQNNQGIRDGNIKIYRGEGQILLDDTGPEQETERRTYSFNDANGKLIFTIDRDENGKFDRQSARRGEISANYQDLGNTIVFNSNDVESQEGVGASLKEFLDRLPSLDGRAQSASVSFGEPEIDLREQSADPYLAALQASGQAPRQAGSTARYTAQQGFGSRSPFSQQFSAGGQLNGNPTSSGSGDTASSQARVNGKWVNFEQQTDFDPQSVANKQAQFVNAKVEFEKKAETVTRDRYGDESPEVQALSEMAFVKDALQHAIDSGSKEDNAKDQRLSANYKEALEQRDAYLGGESGSGLTPRGEVTSKPGYKEMYDVLQQVAKFDREVLQPTLKDVTVGTTQGKALQGLRQSMAAIADDPYTTQENLAAIKETLITAVTGDKAHAFSEFKEGSFRDKQGVRKILGAINEFQMKSEAPNETALSAQLELQKLVVGDGSREITDKGNFSVANFRADDASSRDNLRQALMQAGTNLPSSFDRDAILQGMDKVEQSTGGRAGFSHKSVDDLDKGLKKIIQPGAGALSGDDSAERQIKDYVDLLGRSSDLGSTKLQEKTIELRETLASKSQNTDPSNRNAIDSVLSQVRSFESTITTETVSPAAKKVHFSPDPDEVRYIDEADAGRALKDLVSASGQSPDQGAQSVKAMYAAAANAVAANNGRTPQEIGQAAKSAAFIAAQTNFTGSNPADITPLADYVVSAAGQPGFDDTTVTANLSTATGGAISAAATGTTPPAATMGTTPPAATMGTTPPVATMGTPAGNSGASVLGGFANALGTPPGAQAKQLTTGSDGRSYLDSGIANMQGVKIGGTVSPSEKTVEKLLRPRALRHSQAGRIITKIPYVGRRRDRDINHVRGYAEAVVDIDNARRDKHTMYDTVKAEMTKRIGTPDLEAVDEAFRKEFISSVGVDNSNNPQNPNFKYQLQQRADGLKEAIGGRIANKENISVGELPTTVLYPYEEKNMQARVTDLVTSGYQFTMDDLARNIRDDANAKYSSLNRDEKNYASGVAVSAYRLRGAENQMLRLRKYDPSLSMPGLHEQQNTQPDTLDHIGSVIASRHNQQLGLVSDEAQSLSTDVAKRRESELRGEVLTQLESRDLTAPKDQEAALSKVSGLLDKYAAKKNTVQGDDNSLTKDATRDVLSLAFGSDSDSFKKYDRDQILGAVFTNSQGTAKTDVKALLNNGDTVENRRQNISQRFVAEKISSQNPAERDDRADRLRRYAAASRTADTIINQPAQLQALVNGFNPSTTMMGGAADTDVTEIRAALEGADGANNKHVKREAIKKALLKSINMDGEHLGDRQGKLTSKMAEDYTKLDDFTTSLGDRRDITPLSLGVEDRRFARYVTNNIESLVEDRAKLRKEGPVLSSSALDDKQKQSVKKSREILTLTLDAAGRRVAGAEYTVSNQDLRELGMNSFQSRNVEGLVSRSMSKTRDDMADDYPQDAVRSIIAHDVLQRVKPSVEASNNDPNTVGGTLNENIADTSNEIRDAITQFGISINEAEDEANRNNARDQLRAIQRNPNQRAAAEIIDLAQKKYDRLFSESGNRVTSFDTVNDEILRPALNTLNVVGGVSEALVDRTADDEGKITLVSAAMVMDEIPDARQQLLNNAVLGVDDNAILGEVGRDNDKQGIHASAFSTDGDDLIGVAADLENGDIRSRSREKLSNNRTAQQRTEAIAESMAQFIHDAALRGHGHINRENMAGANVPIIEQSLSRRDSQHPDITSEPSLADIDIAVRSLPGLEQIMSNSTIDASSAGIVIAQSLGPAYANSVDTILSVVQQNFETLKTMHTKDPSALEQDHVLPAPDAQVKTGGRTDNKHYDQHVSDMKKEQDVPRVQKLNEVLVNGQGLNSEGGSPYTILSRENVEELKPKIGAKDADGINEGFKQLMKSREENLGTTGNRIDFDEKSKKQIDSLVDVMDQSVPKKTGQMSFKELYDLVKEVDKAAEAGEQKNNQAFKDSVAEFREAVKTKGNSPELQQNAQKMFEAMGAEKPLQGISKKLFTAANPNVTSGIEGVSINNTAGVVAPSALEHSSNGHAIS